MTDHARAACPTCGKGLTFTQLTLGPEHHAIRCKHCNARLVKRTSAFPILIVGGVVILGVTYFMFNGIFRFAVPVWLGVLAVVGYLTTEVRIAGDDVPDAPNEDLPSGPPPLDPHFRGSSGPPPVRDPDDRS